MNYVENLKAAIATVEAQPVIDLNVWRNACGTIYCIAGLCAVTPHFIEQGMYANACGAPVVEGAEGLDTFDTLELFFGNYEEGNACSAFDRIFCGYGMGAWDREILNDFKNDPDWDGQRLTDRELALARLNKALQIQEERHVDL